MSVPRKMPVTLSPRSLADTPALIETVFPAQKVSFEAQKERKANLGQTLTGLGSYWKGRKPLILVRAIVLGSLLPPTGDAEADLEIFETLMAFDDEGLARRALVQGALKPGDIAARIDLDEPWDYFDYTLKNPLLTAEQVEAWRCPFDADGEGIALRPRARGQVTVVDEIVEQAAETANSLLVPEGLSAATWARLCGIQRFYLRMMDMETTGASKLDNYQNFAKAFRVQDYAKVMASMTANKARLIRITEFASRDLADSTEIGPTWLGRLIIALQQRLADIEPQAVIGQLQEDLPDFLEARPQLTDMLGFKANKAPEAEVRDAAEVFGARLKNLRVLGH